MTRLEKIELAIEKGYTYDEVNGKIYSRFGREITSKCNGYIRITLYNKRKHYHIRAHQFAYYIKYQKIVEQIDHKDGDRTNNKINNLREITNHQNQFNKISAKGYHFNKKNNKFCSFITLNHKTIYLGSFNTEEQARQAYLDAKRKYHLY